MIWEIGGGGSGRGGVGGGEWGWLGQLGVGTLRSWALRSFPLVMSAKIEKIGIMMQVKVSIRKKSSRRWLKGVCSLA